MKFCNKCSTEKPLAEFTKNVSKKDGYESICGNCRRAHMRLYHLENRTERLKVTYKSRAKRKRENMINLVEFLQAHPCVDCGESDVIVLDFDHLRDKQYNISAMMHLSWTSILKEVEKCVVRCANCHRRKTAKEGSWLRLAVVV